MFVMLLGKDSFADAARFACNSYFVYELREQVYLKAGVLTVYLDGKEYPMREIGKEVCDVIGKLQYKDSDDFVTVKIIEFPPRSEYESRSLGVLSLTYSGKRIYDASICPVHDVNMELVERSILYGLPSSIPYTSTDLKTFPHADYPIFGGCVISEDSAPTRYVFLCSRCEEGFRVRCKQKANQAVEATPTAVTPAADAPGAPSAVVPHH